MSEVLKVVLQMVVSGAIGFTLAWQKSKQELKKQEVQHKHSLEIMQKEHENEILRKEKEIETSVKYSFTDKAMTRALNTPFIKSEIDKALMKAMSRDDIK